jgi:hypothetical protein
MTAREAIANLRAVSAELPVEYFLYLAAHSCELCLSSGGRLNDATDFKAFLVELAEATKPTLGKALATVPQQPRWNRNCPRCGHVHEEVSECGMSLGGGRICRCDMEMSA